MQILLIEPDKVLADIYNQALSVIGAVTVAATAQAAIGSMDRTSADIVITELQIANHNGVEFIYELRSYLEWQGVPIILHTLVPPGSLLIDNSIMNTLGIKEYLYKPTTSLQKLVAAVEAAIPITA